MNKSVWEKEQRSAWKFQSSWHRKEFKKQSKNAIGKNYTTVVVACMIMGIFSIIFGSSPTGMTNGEQPFTDTLIQESVGTGNAYGDLFQMADIKKSVMNSHKGVLGGMMHQITTYHSPFLNTIKGVWFGLTENKVSRQIFSFLSVVLGALLTIFVFSIMKVGEKRFFLENRQYEKTEVGRLFYLYKIRCVRRPAWVMVCRYVQLLLWQLTIVGGVIKGYSYRLVPFILAENPTLSKSAAINLSRRMMHGNKWRWFLMDVSFLPWTVLRVFTLGLAGILFVNGYVRETEANLYAHLRTEAKKWNLPDADLLNDELLFQSLDSPLAWYPGTEKEGRRNFLDNQFDRLYPLMHLVIMFFIFSIVGWTWEVSLHLIRDGVFVNRGMLHGFWLPIYGSGGILILIVLKKFRENIFLMFIMTMVLCGIVEYMTSYCLELAFHKKWWDYSGYLLNLNGRICLEGLLVFAIGGCAFVYVLAPIVDNWLRKWPMTYKIIAVVLLVGLFSSDVIYSIQHPNTGDGITSSTCRPFISAEHEEKVAT